MNAPDVPPTVDETLTRAMTAEDVLEAQRARIKELEHAQRVLRGRVLHLAAELRAAAAAPDAVRHCRECGCTDADCGPCIEATGVACHWVDEDLCSACAAPVELEQLEAMHAEDRAALKRLAAAVAKGERISPFEVDRLVRNAAVRQDLTHRPRVMSSAARAERPFVQELVNFAADFAREFQIMHALIAGSSVETRTPDPGQAKSAGKSVASSAHRSRGRRGPSVPGARQTTAPREKKGASRGGSLGAGGGSRTPDPKAPKPPSKKSQRKAAKKKDATHAPTRPKGSKRKGVTP